MKKKWVTYQPDPLRITQISHRLQCHPVVAAVLVNRGVATPEDALCFLNCSWEDLGQPFDLQDMDPALERLHAALVRGEKILIFGDYDVDGITAATLLYEFMRAAGADVHCHIPHRQREGYGLKPEHIQEVAVAQQIGLIITADCGSGSHAALEAARHAGIDVIVTDHHDLSGSLPCALAVINPKRPDCCGAFKGLSGAGVAFYLVICLRKHLRDRNFWQGRAEPNLKQLTDLVALGTVADVVPLVQANRYLVKTGLDVINTGSRPGLKALAALCGSSGAPVDAEDIAFRLGPRLNAAGRMDHARIAFNLLTDRDPISAGDRARCLDALNAQRQATERQLLADIETHLLENPQVLTREAIVLARAHWHEGVLGIVASRLVDKYFRPVVLITLQDGTGKGSARSVPGFDLHGALTACAADLIDFGGHAMAAGLKIKADRLEQFREKFVQTVAHSRDPDGRVAEVQIDAELALNDISDQLIDELEGLQPFGNGNPEPLFMAHGIEILSSSIVGATHRRMRVRQPAGNASQTFQAIHFRVDPQRPPPETPLTHMLYRLRWNRWNGQKRPQLIVEEVK